MRIIIVGAGIAGLSLAIALAQSQHEVLVLDSAAQLAEIGAGIQMTPQAVRYLFHWGLKEDLLAECFVPSRMHFKNGRDGKLLGSVHLDDMERQYGAPYIVVHRAVLHSILHRHAIRAGAQLQLDSRVIRYDFDKGAVELQSGKRLEAGLIIAADGINSSARSQLLGSFNPGSQPTGWAAFRLMAEVSKVKSIPEISHLADLNTRNSHLWISPGKSVMLYHLTLADQKTQMLNIVVSHNDEIDTTDFSLEDHRQTVKELVKEFEPAVRQLIDIALPKIANYPVYQVPPLPKWIHESGRFTLMGDAAHAMAFYLSMGVSLAVEDAACLAVALTKGGSSSLGHAGSENIEKESLKKSLELFETARKERCRAVQEMSLRAGNMMHLTEGSDRLELYKALGHAHEDCASGTQFVNTLSEAMAKRQCLSDGREITLGPGGIADLSTRSWCYGYDALATLT